jgi:hypothetical protein
MSSPAEYYSQQKERYSQLLNKVNKQIARVGSARLWTGVGIIGSAIWAYRSGGGSYWWVPVVAAVLFFLLVRMHLSLSDRKKLWELHLAIIANEVEALKGNNSAFANGLAYVDTSHPYSYDLDLFGKGSIYQMLCRVVTIGGAELLVSSLLKLTLVKNEINERQEIIRELSEAPEFLQEFRVAGSAGSEGAKDRSMLAQWLEAGDLFINSLVARIAIVVMPALSLACIVWSFVIGDFFSYTMLVIITNWILLGIFQNKIKTSAQQISSSAQLIDKYESLLAQVAQMSFKGKWLNETGSNARASADSIRQFKKLVHLFDSRNNGMTAPLMNSLFLFDFYCLLRLESWRKKNKLLLLKAIDEMIVMDVYVSCSVYAFNNPGHSYPQIDENGHEIKGKDLRHPLLAAGAAVGNDVSIGVNERLYLLTGANMTGKSTFIRTIGVSNVLANIGVPLPAAALTLPLLDVYTSMRITDSVQDDVSYFRAELNRIKAIMDRVRDTDSHYLVLLDEPLRGTNSTDKQQGTRSIIETLLGSHVIGIVATHDTSLCDMAASFPGEVSNYHFESQVGTGGLTFDFLLKPGGSTSNNATVLMRQMGIIR